MLFPLSTTKIKFKFYSPPDPRALLAKQDCVMTAKIGNFYKFLPVILSNNVFDKQSKQRS